MQSLKEIQILSGHSARVWCVSWNSEGTLLASCSSDKTIKLWAYSSLLEVWKCQYTESHHHNRTIRWVAWSPCGTFLTSASFDGLVGIWRLEGPDQLSLTLVTDLASHNYEVKRVAFNAKGTLLSSCARDKTVQIWQVDDDGECECEDVLSSHAEDVKTVCWHPIEDILVSGSYDNTIKVYKEILKEWGVVSTLVGHTSTVWQVDFNSLGDILASCSDDRTIRLWTALDNSYTKWLSVAVLEGYHHRVIYDISWSPSLNILSSVSKDNSVCIFKIGEVGNVMNGDVSSGVEVELLSKVEEAHDEDINSCSWRCGHRNEFMTLATGSNDGLIKLWKYTDEDLPID